MRPDSVPYVPVINGLLVERHKVDLCVILLASLLTRGERVLKQ